MWKQTNKFGATFEGSENYYTETKGKHFGQDFAYITDRNESKGKKIPCFEAGKVVVVGNNPKSRTGRQVIIKTNNHYRSYQHLSEIKVNLYQQIEKDKIIGLCGDTGNVTGAHLHTDKYYRLTKPKGLLEHIHAAYKRMRKGIEIITDVYYVNPGIKESDFK